VRFAWVLRTREWLICVRNGTCSAPTGCTRTTAPSRSSV